MDLEKILPANGPSIDEVKKYIEKYLEEVIVIKCGGSVLLNENLFKQFIEVISVIYKLGLSIIVVHGGGKNIKKKLDELNIESKFIDGLRVTDEITIKVVEEALLELNSEIINNLKNLQINAESVAPQNKEVKKPETNAYLVAENIAQQLVKRISYRRAMKRAMQSCIRLGAKGIKVSVSGRLGGNEIARTEWFKKNV